jgi:peptide/nickel transport system substrate-binding protein
MKRLFITLAILVILAFVIAGCSSTNNPATSTTGPAQSSTTAAQPPATTAAASTKPAAPASSTPKYGGTFTLILDTSPGGNIGWPPEYLGEDSVSAQPFYEGLQRVMLDGHAEPLLAESWKLADDKMSITFTLRKGVKFHDGTDFNAQAVKFNYDALIEAKRQVYWKSVEVIDDYTVKVNFTEWRNTLPTSFGGGIVSPTAAQKDGSLDYIRKHPVGTGPFIFESFSRDVATVGVKNPNYWNKGYPYVDKFVIKYVPDKTTQKAAMQNGEGDALVVELGKMTKDMIDLGFVPMSQHQAIFSLFPASKDPNSPFHNEKVRMAVEYALDREKIANLGYGLFNVPYQIIPADNAAFDPNFQGRKYDPAKAKQLLAEAGYPNGFKTTLTPSPVALDKDIDIAVKGYLDAVGIQTTINIVEYNKYMEMKSGVYEGLMLEPTAAFANYYSSLNMYFHPNSIYFPSLDKPDGLTAIIDQCAKSDKIPDIDLIRQAEKYIYDHAVIIPVHDGGKGYALAKYVKGNIFLQLSFPTQFIPENVWIDK